LIQNEGKGKAEEKKEKGNKKTGEEKGTKIIKRKPKKIKARTLDESKNKKEKYRKAKNKYNFRSP
jgi:hypothetical protein